MTNTLVQQLVSTAENISGFPIEVLPDSSLETPAALSMARGDATHHVIRVHPELVGNPDYHICVQCGFIIRHFSVPVPERYDLAPAANALESVVELLQAKRGRLAALPDQQLQGLGKQLLAGLGTQLRSSPIELRVDQWLLDTHPAIQSAQRAAVRRQLVANSKALETQGIIPSALFRPSVAMNAAHALFWAGKLSDDAATTPYRQAGYLLDGRRLLRLWHRIDAAPNADRELIEAWASSLRVQKWFQWVPYQVPAGDEVGD